MPDNDDNETVSESLKRKLGKIKSAPLDPGSPSWDEIRGETWASIKRRARQRKNGVSHLPKTAERSTVRQAVTTEPFAKLMEIIRALKKAQIHYRVDQNRYDGISIEATVPGERWEIDVLEDGEVDFERFVSNGEILERSDLSEYIKRFAEPVEESPSEKPRRVVDRVERSP